VVSTNPITSISASGAISGGNVVSDGGPSVTARGVVYGTIQSPNISNGFTSDGSGVGSFVSTITGLNPLTTYYVRAYATNLVGTAYGNEVSFSTLLTIGTSYAGGIVFYIDGTGQHGLVCAPSDQGSYQWGCYGTNISTQTGFGTGQSNTNLILSSCGQSPIAASVCADLVLNGYDDWFLPSRSELSLMYSNLHTPGIGGFFNTHYWSSSQNGSYLAWVVFFANGDATSSAGKNFNIQSRAIRAF
jgi:hypothetical protein